MHGYLVEAKAAAVGCVCVRLAAHDPELPKARARGPFAGAQEREELRLPPAIVDVWLACDASPAVAAARSALSNAESTITLDSFDRAAFVVWVKPLVPGLRQIQREQG